MIFKNYTFNSNEIFKFYKLFSDTTEKLQITTSMLKRENSKSKGLLYKTLVPPITEYSARNIGNTK